MKRILNIDSIAALSVDEPLIECVRGQVNYYRFLCFHPRNINYVILLNHCEQPERRYYTELIDRFYIDYTEEDIITYKRDYISQELDELEQRLSKLKRQTL